MKQGESHEMKFQNFTPPSPLQNLYLRPAVAHLNYKYFCSRFDIFPGPPSPPHHFCKWPKFQLFSTKNIFVLFQSQVQIKEIKKRFWPSAAAIGQIAFKAIGATTPFTGLGGHFPLAPPLYTPLGKWICEDRKVIIAIIYLKNVNFSESSRLSFFMKCRLRILFVSLKQLISVKQAATG